MDDSVGRRGLARAIGSHLLALSLSLSLSLFAAGCSREAPVPGAQPPQPGAGEPAQTGQPEQPEIGSFDFRLVATTTMPAVPAQTAVFGGVFSGPAVSRLRWKKSAEAGGCGLYQPEAPFCDPPCDGRVCVDDDRCVVEPSLRNAGTVRLEGLRGPNGTEAPIELLAIQSRYQLPVGLPLAYPPFAPGAPVKVSGSGGEVGAFSVSGKGCSPLQVLTADPVTVESGKPIELRWAPPAAGEATVVQVALDLSVHGGTKGKIECEVPDTGSLVIDATLVTRVMALGTAGFPSVVLARSSNTFSALPAGRIKLSLMSEVLRAIEIPGQVSCEQDSDCPSGQVCQGNLLCGRR